MTVIGLSPVQMERHGPIRDVTVTRCPLADITKKVNSVAQVAQPNGTLKLADRQIVAIPSIENQIRAFFEGNPGEPIGCGTEKTVYAGELDFGRGPEPVAIAHNPEGTPCEDPEILAVRARWEALQKQGVYRAYSFTRQYMVDGELVEVAPLMNGHDTSFEGAVDGLALMEAGVSHHAPYPNATLNGIRQILGFFAGLLHFYEDAYDVGSHNVLHGDFKLEQELAGTRTGPSGTNYVAICLSDMPDTAGSQMRTPGMFDPTKMGLDERYHSDDLFALLAVFGQVLFARLTQPLAEGEPEFPIGNVNVDTLSNVLVGGIDPITDPETIAQEKAKGSLLFEMPDGSAYLYAKLLRPHKRDKTIAQLTQIIENKAQSHSGAAAIDVLRCLAKCMKITNDGLKHVMEMEEGGSTKKNTQYAVLKTLKKLDAHVRAQLPFSGPTGSPRPRRASEFDILDPQFLERDLEAYMYAE